MATSIWMTSGLLWTLPAAAAAVLNQDKVEIEGVPLVENQSGHSPRGHCHILLLLQRFSIFQAGGGGLHDILLTNA